jgi:hypothetical protein
LVAIELGACGVGAFLEQQRQALASVSPRKQQHPDALQEDGDSASELSTQPPACTNWLKPLTAIDIASKGKTATFSFPDTCI